MTITKYYCDCCGKEVKTEKDLMDISIYNEFKNMQDNPNPYDTKFICKYCQDQIQNAINDKFNEIKERNK